MLSCSFKNGMVDELNFLSFNGSFKGEFYNFNARKYIKFSGKWVKISQDVIIGNINYHRYFTDFYKKDHTYHVI